MSDELEIKRDKALQEMINVEILPSMPEIDLNQKNITKISLSNLSALGTAFQPLTAAIQSVFSEGGQSGIYFVNTNGKQMFNFKGSKEFLGSLKGTNGVVGGGQARLTQLPCDPTMLFMAAALINIEKKLDAIQETQQEILEFLEEKERATLQGNLNVLNDIITNFKYNWDNEQYKNNKHILEQQIKKEAEASIILYRDQISKKLQKRSFIHGDQEVKSTLKKLQTQFKDYQLALYLYAYSTFLEIMLLGNFNKGYLESVEKRISEYSYQYRALYTECYNLMEKYSKTSVQSGVMNGLASASKFMGNTIAKMPVISDSQLDENLIKASGKLQKHSKKKTTNTLEELTQTRFNVVLPFIENIQKINALYNEPNAYLFDK